MFIFCLFAILRFIQYFIYYIEEKEEKKDEEEEQEEEKQNDEQEVDPFDWNPEQIYESYLQALIGTFYLCLIGIVPQNENQNLYYQKNMMLHMLLHVI